MSTVAGEPGRKQPTPAPYLYSRGRPHCDVRYCRTHALLAELFASPVGNPHNAAAWTYISQAWTALADIKQRAVDEPGWQTLRVRSGVFAAIPAITGRPEPTVEGVQHGHDQGQGRK